MHRFAFWGFFLWRVACIHSFVVSRSHEKWRMMWNNNEIVVPAKERTLNANLHPRRLVMTYCANFCSEQRASDSEFIGSRSSLKSDSFEVAFRLSDLTQWHTSTARKCQFNRHVTPLHHLARETSAYSYLRGYSAIICRKTWDLINVISCDVRLHFSKRCYRFVYLYTLQRRARERNTIVFYQWTRNCFAKGHSISTAPQRDHDNTYRN